MEALTWRAEIDPQLELRFFNGLSVEWTAKFLDVSERTVKRELQYI
ncbi:MAG: ECF-type sigma factor [Pyrinomonadaceae bacterium]